MPRAAGSRLVESYARSPEMAAALSVLSRGGAALGGFWGASLAFFLRAWRPAGKGASAEASGITGPSPRGPVMLIGASGEESSEIVDELRAFGAPAVLELPAWESLFLPDSRPDPETFRDRLLVLDALRRGSTEDLFIVAPVQAVLQPVPSRAALEASRLALRSGDSIGPEALAGRLVRKGFRASPLVASPGELSWRGDILDLFPHVSPSPLRLEFFGDTLESIREFSADTQRSSGALLESLDILVPSEAEMFRDAPREGDELIIDRCGGIFVHEPTLVLERAGKLLEHRLGPAAGAALERFEAALASVPVARTHVLPVPPGESSLNLRFASVERFRGADLETTFAALGERIRAGQTIDVYCENEAEAQRFAEIARDHGLSGEERLDVRAGAVRRGFEAAALDAFVLTSREIFNRHAVRRARQRRPGRAIRSFLDLQKGDYVVHVAHGIGIYLGMESFEKNGALQEFLAIEFRDKVKVYVPVSRIDLVQKYVGGGERQPVLDRVGSSSWTRRKETVETALLDLASELLDVQALRKERPGFAYPADTEWQREFEAAFPHEETPDQVEVNLAIKKDMETPRPMDRLLCGDVGYGKTELAMRATFKAVDAGKQVAILVPTTVLAQQHFRTFSERMAGFPIRIGMLSRFRTPSEQRETIEAAASGALDILIGTHRLLSDDVSFRDLGLVVIDEEQRFGVAHKEKLKRMRSTVEVLTLTATPIPRTLHMALLGIRDISSLSTAPQGRNAVETEIARFDPLRVREIVIRELDRDGQVFFVHNKIYDIDVVTRRLSEIVPEARIEFAHGQMNEHELEDKMLRFYEREFDVLVSTTIIESGLDIPNVNTIFIDEADRYGLADLHQLRGRVGRYKHQAYCYLLLPTDRRVEADAQKRVQALVEFSELGAGFQIALRDLEIRGAGNILGPEQSGHIAAVGYELYSRLLEKAVKQLKNDLSAEPLSVEVDLELEAFFPEAYLGDESARIEIYRRIGEAPDADAVDELGRELTDRFGPYPEEVARLLDLQKLRILCAARDVERVTREERDLVLRGGKGLQDLIDACPARVVVTGAREVHVSLVDPRRRYSPQVDDEKAFRALLRWLESGIFPESGLGAAPRAVKAGPRRTP